MKLKLFLSRFLFCLLSFLSSKSFAQNVVLDLSGNYTVTASSSIVWDFKYKPSLQSTFTISPTNQFASNIKIRLNPFISWDFVTRYYFAGIPSEGTPLTINADYAANPEMVGTSFDFNTSPLLAKWRGYRLANTPLNTYCTVETSSILQDGITTKSVKLGSNNGFGVMLVSPRINNLATDKKIKISLSSDQASAPLIVGTMTDPYDQTTFHPLTSLYATYYYANKTIFLNNYNGIDKYVAFKYTETQFNNIGYFIDDFSIEQSVNCFDTSNVSVTGITETNAQLNFDGNGQNTWEVSLTNLRNNFIQNFTTTNNTYILSGLSGNTNYEVKIRASCAPELFSNWSPTVSFSTACQTISAGYSTSFGDYSYIDPCWKTITNSSDFYQAPLSGTNVVPRTGSKMIMMQNSSTMATQKSFLISPYVQDLDNNKRIKFFLLGKGNFVKNSITIGTMSDPANDQTFVPLNTILPTEINEPDGYDVNSYWKEHIVYFNNYNNALNHHYIVIKQNNLDTWTSLFLDDFTYESIPACNEVTDLKTVKTTFNTAKLQWTSYANSLSTEWQIEYGVTGFQIGSGIQINATTNPFTIISNLNPDTQYDFYVRSKCVNSYSNWSDRGYFKTKCEGVTIGYTTSFENDVFESNSCWLRLIPKIRDSYYYKDSFIKPIPYAAGQFAIPPRTGLKSIVHHNRSNVPIANSSDRIVLVTPRLKDFGNNRKISFWMYCQYSNYIVPQNVIVGTLSDPDDYTTFTPFFALTNTSQFEDQWKYYEVDFSSYTGTDKFIGIRQAQANLGQVVAFDDFSYFGIGCQTPTSLKIQQSSENSASLIWNSNDINTNWEIEYGIMGFAPGSGTLISTTTNPCNLQGLNTTTKYEFRVRNKCSTTVFGDWSTKYAFKLSCIKTAPYNENFDAFDASTIDYTTFCWTRNNYGARIVNFSLFDNVTSNPNYLLLNTITSPSNTQIAPYIVTPYLSDFDNTKRLKIWAANKLGESIYQPSIGSNLIIGTMSNPIDESTFKPFQTINLNNLPSTGKQFIINFSSYVGTDKHIAFRHDGIQNDFNNYIHIDDFYYDSIPTCIEPLNVLSKEITSTSAKVEWDLNPNAPSYQIEYGVSGFLQGTGTILNATSNNSQLSGLLQNTAYQYYIKTICNQSSQSLVYGPRKFKTACTEATIPWLEDFNSMPQYGLGILPNCSKFTEGCFESRNVTTPVIGNSFEPDNTLTGFNDTTFLRARNANSVNYMNNHFTSPNFNLVAGTTYTFSMMARTYYEYGLPGLRMLVGKGNNYEDMQISLNKIGYLSEYQYNEIKFVYTPVTSGSYCFDTRFTTGGSLNIILDNLKLIEGYTSNITTNNTVFDFTVIDEKTIIESTDYSKASIITDQSNTSNKVLWMKGSNTVTDWNPFGDNWENNQNNITKVNMKVNTAAMTSLYLRFDLNQTFLTTSDNSKFRVLVNGNVIGEIGSDVLNRNANASNTYQYNLSQYLGSDIRISLQHIGKSIGDDAFLDNLIFSPTASLSNSDFSFSKLKVFPNPANDYVFIENNEVITKIEIATISGQILHSVKNDNNKLKLNFSNYSNGVYFIKVFSNDSSKTIKIIKN